MRRRTGLFEIAPTVDLAVDYRPGSCRIDPDWPIRHGPGGVRSPRGLCPLWSSFVCGRQARLQINLASSVIAALRTFETGQFFSASLTIRANATSSRPGTLARRVRAD